MNIVSRFFQFLFGEEVTSIVQEPIPLAPTAIHNGSGPLITLRYHKHDELNEQRHSVETTRPLIVCTCDWPKREPWEQPAVMVLWVRHKDSISRTIEFGDEVQWWSEHGPLHHTPAYRGKDPMFRLWSWGNGVVYASEVTSPFSC